MNSDLILTAVALFPAIVLCIYVFAKDRVEKEPIGLLLVLLGAGALTTIPASFLEETLGSALNGIFAPFTYEKDGVTYLVGMTYYLYHALKYFVVVALVEEGVKWTALKLITRNNKNFNSLFDGVIYSVFVSLGFAALENIMYAFNHGMSTAIARMVTAVPAHMFFAVLMGYYYSWWNVYRKADAIERELMPEILNRNVSYGAALPFPIKKYMRYSLLVPTLAHGLYDYCCTIGGYIATIAFYVFLAFLYIHCFGKIKKMSKQDISDNQLARLLVRNRYPDLF